MFLAIFLWNPYKWRSTKWARIIEIKDCSIIGVIALEPRNPYYKFFFQKLYVLTNLFFTFKEYMLILSTALEKK